MAVGQKAEIRVDSFPGHKLRGHLLLFAPGSGAQFTLLPPDNATGNFTKVVQRIPVKIAIDDADGLADRLVPGMSVEARSMPRIAGDERRLRHRRGLDFPRRRCPCRPLPYPGSAS